jgi:HAD superfamily hydrolase (TIGR01509 family)
LGLEIGELDRLVFSGEVGRRAAIGLAEVEDVWQRVCADLDLSPLDCEQIEEDFWSGDRVDHELIAYIKALRRSYTTGLLSNAWKDLRHFVEHVWEIADTFDAIVISAEVGVAKPDAEIYRVMLEELGVEAEQAVFIDDFPENLAGARQVGMRAIHFTDPGTARVRLEKMLADSGAVDPP